MAVLCAPVKQYGGQPALPHPAHLDDGVEISSQQPDATMQLKRSATIPSRSRFMSENDFRAGRGRILPGPRQPRDGFTPESDAQPIPVSEPVLGDAERASVLACLESGWISSGGRFIEEFEERWAAYCGRRHGIAVSNGSTGLHAALVALGIGPGDEVIIPTFTIISCCTAVLQCGATPVLVDADPVTWCMDVGDVARKITARTRAVMPVHIYGHAVDMDPLLALADAHGLFVVEDAAEAHGAEYRTLRGGIADWRRCGSFGHVSVFSFYANKLVTTGEGGMVLTDDDALAARLRRVRNLGFGPRRFVHADIGFNYRMTSLQAALGIPQIERLPASIAAKRSMAAVYRRGLADVAGLSLPAEQPWARSVYWMFGITLPDREFRSADDIARELLSRGVETRPFFVGMHWQPALQSLGLFSGETFPVADHLSSRGLYLPSGAGLTAQQLSRVVETVRSVLC